MPSINSPTPDATTASKGKVQLTNNLAGTAALPLLSITAIKLGYTQITASITTTSTTVVQATGLTQTVTVPTGGRGVKVTVYARDVFASASSVFQVSIWDGTVGSGTQIGGALFNNAGTTGITFPLYTAAFVTPSAGSKTYNIGFLTSGGTLNVEAAAAYPAYILVELI